MTEIDPPLQRLRQVQRLTAALREGSEQRWRRLRERLDLAGVDAGDAALVVLGPHDTTMEYGLIVTRNNRAFEFSLEWGYDEAGHELDSYIDAWLWEWAEVRLEDVGAKGSPEVEAGLSMLRGHATD
jgi:hypothetical protein